MKIVKLLWFLWALVAMVVLSNAQKNRPEGWTKHPFSWCTVAGRDDGNPLYTQVGKRITFVECQNLCVSRPGCKAVEVWTKFNWACYVCTDTAKITPYTYEEDLAYPVHVWVQNPQTKVPLTTTQEPTISLKQTTEQPITRKQNTEQPITRKQTTDQPITRKQNTEQPITRKQNTEQPITRKQNTEQPITRKQSTEQPITRKQLTEQSITRKKDTEQPITRKQNTEQPTNGKQTTEQPITRKQITEQPITRKLNTEQPTNGKQTPEPQGWTKHPFGWCTLAGRDDGNPLYTQVGKRITFVECQNLCVSRPGCKAVEFWTKNNWACYVCTDTAKITPYTYKEDLAYPVHVWVQNPYTKAPLTTTDKPTTSLKQTTEQPTTRKQSTQQPTNGKQTTEPPVGALSNTIFTESINEEGSVEGRTAWRKIIHHLQDLLNNGAEGERRVRKSKEGEEKEKGK